jgi:hypothetical protein
VGGRVWRKKKGHDIGVYEMLRLMKSVKILKLLMGAAEAVAGQGGKIET